MTGRVGQVMQPWAGLIAGLIGIVIAHQFGADGEFDDCQRFAPGPLLVVAALCILLALAGAWASAIVIRRSPDESTAKTVAVISTGFALIASFGIVLPMIASVILPACFQ